MTDALEAQRKARNEQVTKLLKRKKRVKSAKRKKKKR